jgi:hypothetical protein
MEEAVGSKASGECGIAALSCGGEGWKGVKVARKKKTAWAELSPLFLF